MDEDFDQFQYCQDNPVFFTRPSARADKSPAFHVSVPPAWYSHRDGEWSMRSASRHSGLPEQGWKVHVSSILKDADEVLRATVEVCTDFNVAFKFLATVKALFLRNSKNFPRGHAGKFITCYPPVDLLEVFLDALEVKLSTHSGPYILSDKRWKDAPIYLRYGAFRRITMPLGGVEVPAIRDPQGRLLPDDRGAVFAVPKWAEVPPFLREWVDAYPDDLEESSRPFEVESAIKFSNSGGVYRGRMTVSTGVEVVIKEARLHAGLDGARRTAGERILTENAALADLSSLGIVPKVQWFGRLWEHDFLCMDFVKGVTLQKWIGRNFPLYGGSGDAQYYRRVLAISRALVEAVEAIHHHGWTHQDLHPRNVILESIEPVRIKIIDFEGARRPDGVGRIQEFGFPGYRSLRDRTPEQTDWHGIRQMIAYMALPLINLCELNEQYTLKTQDFAQNRNLSSAALSSLDEIQTLLSALRSRSTASPPKRDQQPLLGVVWQDRPAVDTAALAEATTSGIVWALENAASEALPTHYEGLSSGQHGLAFGAAGILLAMCSDWRSSPSDSTVKALLKATRTSLQESPGPGLFTGHIGDLLGLSSAGCSAEIDSYLQEHFEEMLGAPGKRVYDGLPGVVLGLTWLTSASPDTRGRFRERLRHEVAALVFEYRSAPSGFAPVGEPGRVMANQARFQDSGLLYGHLGMAWLFATAATAFSEPSWMDTAVEAIENELSRYDDSDGRLQFKQAGRLLPYLATGSAGLGIVLPLLPPRLLGSRLREVADKALAAVELDFCSAAGLFNGHAGLMLGAVGLRRVLGRPGPVTAANLQALELHALTAGDALVFAGDSEFRVSTDLATGAAGIVFALSHMGEPRALASEIDTTSGPGN